MLTTSIKSHGWHLKQTFKAKSFICGFCNTNVSSEKGYKLGLHEDGSGEQRGGILICPECNNPNFITFFNGGNQIPASPSGNPVKNTPKEINTLYEEARKCTSSNCYTAAVMTCRKILMNIAVDNKAKEGLSFVKYVEHLSNEGYTPPNGKAWVDHIRKKGNEANHEIHIMTKEDAEELIIFIEMLLKFIYEFPAKIPTPPKSNN